MWEVLINASTKGIDGVLPFQLQVATLRQVAARPHSWCKKKNNNNKTKALFVCFFPWTGLPCFQNQTDIKELLETLGQNVVTKKRKNVEILWTAGTVSRVVALFLFLFRRVKKDRSHLSLAQLLTHKCNLPSHSWLSEEAWTCCFFVFFYWTWWNVCAMAR